MTEVGDTIQEMTVTQDKSFNGSIDKGYNTNQLMIKAASRILKQNTDEVLVPAVDKYRLSVLAAGAGMSALATSFTKTNAIQTIMAANAAMSNALVPDTGRVLYIGYTDAVELKLADQVIGVDKLAEKVIVNGVCGKIDKCQVRIVPDSYLPNDVRFIIVKTGVACAPKKIETFRVITEDKDIDGSIVQGRLMHDCFVLNTKRNGIYCAYKTGYTVTFNANGHGTAPTAVAVAPGGKVSAPAALEATGYVFGGWYTTSACTTAFDFTSAINSNTTVYAKWTQA